MSPRITSLFKHLAEEKGFTGEMIRMLPSQGEHCPAPCRAGSGDMEARTHWQGATQPSTAHILWSELA